MKISLSLLSIHPKSSSAMPTEHFDVLIIGAGLSGIGAARHLQMRCADRSYAILEGRSSMGGTWDLFRYPGVRSDSDMYTLGYAFKPWAERKAIADGPSILQYVRDTAHENDIERHIRFGHQVKSAAWSSADARWTVQVLRGDGQEPVQISCNFLFMCSGYYRYDEGFTPDFAGLADFAGRVVHPQQWTDDIAYADKRVVVIGSGATAVTLVPELAKQAAHVTMLQRSPTYIVALASEDAFANRLRRWLPGKLAYSLTRWKRVLLGLYIFQLCRSNPAKVKRLIEGGVRMALGPDYDVAQHFTPRYNPWDQRLCLAPDGDFFAAIKSGSASVATDEIARFTKTGIALKSGAHLDADLIVTATGLNLQVLGGLQWSVDGVAVDPAKTLNYKGLMFSGVPNLASSFGYTNASWTLKCDLICEYVCRLLNHMQKHSIKQCTPRNADASITELPWVDFSSSYFARSMHLFPKQGSKAPWKLYQNYPKDILLLRYGKLNDGVLQFA
jgi:monooxygenase